MIACTAVGRLINEPELVEAGDDQVVNLRIATFRRLPSGSARETRIRASMWGASRAVAIADKFRRGDLVVASGCLEAWQDSRGVTQLYLRCDRIDLITSEAVEP